MADRIITVTDPSVVTNDTLSGYNNYSDIDGQLGTTMTPTEATNGKTVTLSDGVVHEVTTKPVGTTNGEFSAVVSNAVEVDLTAGGYGLSLLASNGASIRIPVAIGTNTWELNFVPDNLPVNTEMHVATNSSTTTNGYFEINAGTVNKPRVTWYDTSSHTETSTVDFTAGDKITFRRASATSFQLLISDVLAIDATCDASYDLSNSYLSIGSRNGVTDFVDCNYSSITLQIGAGPVETILPTSQSSGTPFTGSEGTEVPITATSVDACYYAI